MKVRCPKCNYEWNTNSKLIKVSCSSCGAKIKIRERLKLEHKKINKVKSII